MCQVQAHGLAPVGDGPPGPGIYSTACSCDAIVSSVVTEAPTVVIGMNKDGSLWSATETISTVLDPAFTPPTDCCVECLITAADVQILYWPVETASPNNTSTANNLFVTAAPPVATPYSYVENGMTFVSPSVYVAYRSLGAAEYCPAFGPNYFGHGNATDITIGYAPDALSTSMCNGPPAGFQLYTAINYTELQYPTGSQTQGTCEWRIGSSGTPRGPYLSIPTNINKVNPAWNTCKGAFEGTFDPPSTLRKATAMVGPTSITDKGPSATPGPSISPVNAPMTASIFAAVPAALQPVKPDTPISNPGSTDPGNPGFAKNPVKPANTPPDPNNGDLAAQSDSQNGASGSSNPSQNLDPTKSQPASGNGGLDPGTGSGTGSGSGSGSDSGYGPVPGPGAGAGAGSGSGSGGSSSGSRPGSGPGSGAGSGSGSNIGSSTGPGTTPALNSVVANGNTIVRDPNGGVVVGSSTVMPGNTVQVAGAPLSVGTDHVVLGGSSYALPAATTAGAVLVGSSAIVKASNGGVVIGGSTVAPGVQTAVAGYTISVGSSHAVVNGITYALPASAGAVVQAAPALSPVFGGSQSVVIGPNGGIIIGSSTFAPGAQATIAGKVVSVGSSSMVIGGTTYSLPTNPGAVLQQAPNLAQNLASGSKVTLANGAIITAGGASVTIGGSVIGIPSGGSGLIVNGKTVPLPTNSVFTVAGQTFTAAPTAFAVAGQSLSPGGSAITLSGTVLSLGPSGLQVGSSTIPLSSPQPSVFTIAGQTFTASPSGFAIGSQTLLPGGPALTLSGNIISLGPSGLQIGTSTIPLTPTASASASASSGLGGLIMGGYGSTPTTTASNSSGLLGVKRAASRMGSDAPVRSLAMLLAIGVGVVVSVL